MASKRKTANTGKKKKNPNMQNHTKTNDHDSQNKMPQKSDHNKTALSTQINICGLHIPQSIYSNNQMLFIFLACSHIVCSLIFALLQEKVTSVEGFKYPKFMTLIQTFTFTICAFIEMKTTKGANGDLFAPKAPKLNYFLLSFLTFSGMLFTNWGLNYITYPTRIIFKGAKPVPTMILEYFYVGKLFTISEIISVAILTCGIILFCSGEASDAPSFHLYGILLMVLGVTADSLTSNYEKKNIFKFGSSHTEAMFWASLYGSIWSILFLFFMDHALFFEALSFFIFGSFQCTLWLIASSIGAYMSVVFVLLLIKMYSTTYAECVKGLRKVLSIALSYLLLNSTGKVFGSFHALGISCFILSILLTIYTKSKR